MVLRQKTQAIVIHCTATLAHMDFRRTEIRAMHLRRGFSDIGYHYLIPLNGVTENGRVPDLSIGSHVHGFNNVTLGIAYVGGLRSSDAQPMDTRRPEQIKAMEDLLRKLVVKYPDAVILGHRDLSPDLNHDGVIDSREWLKVCPCFDVGPWAKSLGLPGGRYSNGHYELL